MSYRITVRNAILAAAVALGTAACSTVEFGRNYDLRTFETNVQRGSTTQTQVRGWLGAPNSTGVVVDTNGDRYQEWTYYYGHGRLPNMVDAQLKVLQIKFDDLGVVRAYNWSGDSK